MSQSRDNLHEVFQNEINAWNCLKGNYTHHHGMISVIDPDHKETQIEKDAIDYLCGECDWSYDSTIYPKVKSCF